MIEPIRYLDAMIPMMGMTEEEKKKLLNINTATLEDWKTLPKMTDELAQGIIDYRDSLGGRFEAVEELWYYIPAKKNKKKWEKLITTTDEEK